MIEIYRHSTIHENREFLSAWVSHDSMYRANLLLGANYLSNNGMALRWGWSCPLFPYKASLLLGANHLSNNGMALRWGWSCPLFPYEASLLLGANHLSNNGMALCRGWSCPLFSIWWRIIECRPRLCQSTRIGGSCPFLPLMLSSHHSGYHRRWRLRLCYTSQIDGTTYYPKLATTSATTCRTTIASYKDNSYPVTSLTVR
jgi:hypothetical protein